MKRRWRWSLGCLSVLVIIFAYRVLSVYEFRSGDCLARPEQATFEQTYPRRLLVMTYNVQGHAAFVRADHVARIADAINQTRPDIVAVNEAHRRTWQSRFRDHVEELRLRTGMNAVFGESYQQLGGQFGNAILTRGNIVRHDLYKLPGIGEPRTLLEATIEIDGGTVEFYVTHLAAWEKLNREVRRKQLQCLSRHVRASRHPFILAGDINAPPDSPEVKEFLRDTRLQMCGPTEPTHKVMNLAIDYLFTDRGWHVLDARSLDIGPSDHRPVVAELSHDTQTR
jgi:endonuclease/exonuclease/phosphatase family metal-dependent hydrolase